MHARGARGAAMRALAGLLAAGPARGLLLPHGGPEMQAANDTAEREQGRSVVFWHVANSDQVVLDQLEQLLQTPFAGAVKFVARGCDSPRARPSPSMLRKLRATPGLEEVPRHEIFACGREYFEMPTLWALHEHCQAHPKDFVAYIHTKRDASKRHYMMDRLLQSRACIDGCLAAGKVACGANLHAAADGPCPGSSHSEPGSDCAWCHFSGNFWWARCDYVATLNPPWDDQLLDEVNLHRKWKGWWGDVRPYGRFFAEWWLLNDVQARHRKGAGSVVMDYDTSTITGPRGRTSFLRQAHLVQPLGCPSNGTYWGSDLQAERKLTAAALGALKRQRMHPQEMHWKGLCPASLGYANLEDRVCQV